MLKGYDNLMYNDGGLDNFRQNYWISWSKSYVAHFSKAVNYDWCLSSGIQKVTAENIEFENTGYYPFALHATCYYCLARENSALLGISLYSYLKI